jgi:hypothetical protein
MRTRQKAFAHRRPRGVLNDDSHGYGPDRFIDEELDNRAASRDERDAELEQLGEENADGQ